MNGSYAAGGSARHACRPPRSSRLRAAGLALGILAATSLAGCRDRGPTVVLHGSNGATRVAVELALTPEQQSRGLMWRNQMDEDAGMLFVFHRERDQSFWMKNTPLPLDIIYIGADSKVVSVAADTVPYSQTSIPSDGPAQYVLEVNAGFAREHGIGPGTRVELPALPAADKKTH